MGDPQNAWFIDGKIHENPIYKWTPMLGTITVTYINRIYQFLKRSSSLTMFDIVWHPWVDLPHAHFESHVLPQESGESPKKDWPNPQQIRTFHDFPTSKMQKKIIHQRSEYFWITPAAPCYPWLVHSLASSQALRPHKGEYNTHFRKPPSETGLYVYLVS